jgi:hypothetical protein
VLPLPRWVLFVVMCLSTAVSGLLRRKNQLDIKQYRQMTARAFVCSGARLTEDLGWAPRHGLRACLANAAQGYRLSGRLRPAALPSV